MHVYFPVSPQQSTQTEKTDKYKKNNLQHAVQNKKFYTYFWGDKRTHQK